MSLLKVNEIQIFNGTTVTITATTTETSADLNVGADLDVTGALTLGTALAVAEGGTGATDAATARTNLDVDQAGTDNSTDVTLVTTSHDYLSISGQAITLGPIDLAADVTGNLPYASISGTPTLGTAAAEDVGYFATAAQGSLADSAVQPGDDAADLGSGAATDGYVLTADGAGGAAWEAASGVGSQSAFSATPVTQLNVTGDGTSYTVTGASTWTEIFDLNSNFSNGTFTAPVTGKYLFTVRLPISGLGVLHTVCIIYLYTSNRYYTWTMNPSDYYQTSFGGFVASFSQIADMDASDTAYLQIIVINGTKTVDIASTYGDGAFTGMLLA